MAEIEMTWIPLCWKHNLKRSSEISMTFVLFVKLSFKSPQTVIVKSKLFFPNDSR